MMTEQYSIKDLERITGIKAHTIRIWEKRYNIVQPERSDTNIRFYSDENLKKLLNVSILVKNGYKISKVADLDNKQISEKIIEISRLSHNYTNQIESLIVSMIELDEIKFESILNNTILKLGFEKTVFDILYPLFQRIGVLWQVGSINPAQEHFLSNLIRRKMLVATDGLSPVADSKAKQFILFLPEWELHEIGLLLFEYLLRKHGYKVIYLGQSLPMDDVVSIGKTTNPDYILTSFTSSRPRNEMRSYIDTLSSNFPEQTIIITGIQVSQLSNLPKNIKSFPSALSFRDEFLS
jgi:DNA-binding transcriptional MerR regulator/methylmalonyl-CoA mutase cobalamin-binding subunit